MAVMSGCIQDCQQLKQPCMCPERDPDALVPVAVEGAVLAALDSETDAALA